MRGWCGSIELPAPYYKELHWQHQQLHWSQHRQQQQHQQKHQQQQQLQRHFMFSSPQQPHNSATEPLPPARQK